MFSVKSTTEMAIMVEFEAGIQARLPLTNKDKLCTDKFPLAVSFIYGEHDWTLRIDKDSYKQIIECNMNISDCHMHIVPDSDHNMH